MPSLPLLPQKTLWGFSYPRQPVPTKNLGYLIWRWKGKDRMDLQPIWTIRWAGGGGGGRNMEGVQQALGGNEFNWFSSCVNLNSCLQVYEHGLVFANSLNFRLKAQLKEIWGSMPKFCVNYSVYVSNSCLIWVRRTTYWSLWHVKCPHKRPALKKEMALMEDTRRLSSAELHGKILMLFPKES